MGSFDATCVVSDVGMSYGDKILVVPLVALSSFFRAVEDERCVRGVLCSPPPPLSLPPSPLPNPSG